MPKPFRIDPDLEEEKRKKSNQTKQNQPKVNNNVNTTNLAGVDYHQNKPSTGDTTVNRYAKAQDSLREKKGIGSALNALTGDRKMPEQGKTFVPETPDLPSKEDRRKVKENLQDENVQKTLSSMADESNKKVQETLGKAKESIEEAKNYVSPQEQRIRQREEERNAENATDILSGKTSWNGYTIDEEGLSKLPAVAIDKRTGEQTDLEYVNALANTVNSKYENINNSITDLNKQYRLHLIGDEEYLNAYNALVNEWNASPDAQELSNYDYLTGMDYYNWLKENGTDDEVKQFEAYVASFDDSMFESLANSYKATMVDFFSRGFDTYSMLRAKADEDYDYNDPTHINNQMAEIADEYRSYTLNGINDGGVRGYSLQVISSLMPMINDAIVASITGGALGLEGGALRTFAGNFTNIEMGIGSAGETLRKRLAEGNSFDTSFWNAVAHGVITGAVEALNMGNVGNVVNLFTGAGVNVLGIGMASLPKVTEMVMNQIADAHGEGLEEIYETALDFAVDSMTNGLLSALGSEDRVAVETPMLGGIGDGGLTDQYVMGALGAVLLGGVTNGKLAIDSMYKYNSAGRARTYIQTAKSYYEMQNDIENAKICDVADQFVAHEMQTYEQKSQTKGAVQFASDQASPGTSFKEAMNVVANAYKLDVDNQINVAENVRKSGEKIYDQLKNEFARRGYSNKMNIETYAKATPEIRDASKKIMNFANEIGADLRITDNFTYLTQNGELKEKQLGWDENGLAVYNDTIVLNPFAEEIVNGTKELSPSEMMESVFAHELTHTTEKTGSYKNLEGAVREAMGKENWKKEFDQLFKRYSEHNNGKAVSEKVVNSEVVANYIQKNMGNEKFLQTISDYNGSLFTKMYTGMRALLKHDPASKVANAFFKAYEERIDQAMKSSQPTNVFGDMISSNGIQCNLSQYKEKGRYVLVRYLKKMVDNGSLDTDVADDIYNTLEFYAQKIDEMTSDPDQVFQNFSNWSVVNMSEDQDGNPLLTCVVKNDDYEMNIDFSTVCKKRKFADAVFNELARSGALDKKALSPTDIATLRQAIKDNDLEVACNLCFVDSRRFRQGSWADTLVNGKKDKIDKKLVELGVQDPETGHIMGWNELVDKLANDPSEVGEFNFAGRESVKEGTLHTLSDKEVNQKGLEFLRKVNKGVSKGTEIGHWTKALLNNPELRKHLLLGDLYGSEAFGRIRRGNEELFTIINTHQGSAKPKSPYLEVTYNNEIITRNLFDAVEARKVGGVRIQSFSDFMTNMVFDYMEMVAELQAKDLPAHAYTKVKEFAELFGMTGIKINLSIIPKATTLTPEEVRNLSDEEKKEIKRWAGLERFTKEQVEEFKNQPEMVDNKPTGRTMYDALVADRGLGLSEDGSCYTAYLFDDESYDWVDALEMQSREGYDRNVGTICVGVSDEHIWKMMADDNVKMIIPYHLSSLNPAVAHMMNIGTFNDYTSYQHTRSFANGRWGALSSDDEFAFYEDGMMTNGYDAKATSLKYLKWCAKNHYLPKFNQFAYIEDSNGDWKMRKDGSYSYVGKGKGNLSFNENYYKVLIDFRAYDSQGNIAPQVGVAQNYPGDYMEKLREYLTNYEEITNRQKAKLPGVVNEVKEKLSLSDNDGLQFNINSGYEKGRPKRLKNIYNGPETEYANFVEVNNISGEELNKYRAFALSQTVAEPNGTYIINDDNNTYLVAKLGDSIKIGGIIENELYKLRINPTRGVFSESTESIRSVFGDYHGDPGISQRGRGSNNGTDGLVGGTPRGGADGKPDSIRGKGSSSLVFKKIDDNLYDVGGKEYTYNQLYDRLGPDIADVIVNDADEITAKKIVSWKNKHGGVNYGSTNKIGKTQDGPVGPFSNGGIQFDLSEEPEREYYNTGNKDIDAVMNELIDSMSYEEFQKYLEDGEFTYASSEEVENDPEVQEEGLWAKEPDGDYIKIDDGYTSDGKTVAWKDERIDALIKENESGNLADGPYKYFYAVNMSPHDYRALSYVFEPKHNKIWNDEINDEYYNYGELKPEELGYGETDGRLAHQMYFKASWTGIGDRYKIEWQEGNHRSIILDNSGYSKMPIVLGTDRPISAYLKLLGMDAQRMGVSNPNEKIFNSADVVELKSENYGKLVRKFGSGVDANIQYSLKENSDDNYGYHYGAKDLDLNKKSETLWQRGGRGTGAFGTGTYFFGNGRFKSSYMTDDGKTEHKVDFSNYNLFRPKDANDGYKLHDFFKSLDDNYTHTGAKSIDEYMQSISDIISKLDNSTDVNDDGDIVVSPELEEEIRERLSSLGESEEVIDKLFDDNRLSDERIDAMYLMSDLENQYLNYQDSWHKTPRSIERTERYGRIGKKTPEIASILGEDEDYLTDVVNEAMRSAEADTYKRDFIGGNYDSVGTRVMKKLGYDGIDVRNIEGLDNSTYGSVIYNLEPESIQYDLSDNYDYGVNPVRKIDIPKQTEKGPTSKATRTIANSAYVSDKEAKAIQKMARDGLLAYEKASNKEQSAVARDMIKKMGFKKAYKYAMNTNSIETSGIDTVFCKELLNEMRHKGQEGTDAYNKLLTHTINRGSMLGQGVQAYKTFKEQTPEVRIITIQSEMQRLTEGLKKRWGKKAPNLKLNEKLVSEYLRDDITEEQRDKILGDLAQDIADQIPPTIMEQLNSWRYFAMLSNPKTWVKNALSNVVNGYLGSVTRAMRSVAEGLYEQAGGEIERETGVYNPFSSADREVFKKARADYDAHYSDQVAKYSELDILDTKGDFISEVNRRRKKFRWDWLNKLSDFEGRMMSDRPAMSKAYAKAMVGYLKAKGLTIDTASEQQMEKAREYAYKEARYDTLNSDNWLATAITDLEKKADKQSPATGMATRMVVESFVPFKRVPMNSVKEAFDYSPLGLIRAVSLNLDAVRKGQMSANTMLTNLCRGLSGSAIVGLGFILAHMGIFRTKDDDKDRKKYFDKDNGEQDYSINWPGGSATIDWIDPLIVPLSMGAEVEKLQSDGTLSLEDAWSLCTSLAEPIFETTMMSGITNNLKDYANDSAGYTTGILGNAVTNYGMQYIPTILGALERTIDDTRRTTYPNEGKLDKARRKAFNKVPGLAQKNEPYINKQGQEQKNEDLGIGAVGRAILNFGFPGYYSSKDIDKYDEEAYRLYESTGSMDAFPSDDTTDLSYNKEKYKFSPKEYTEWHKTRWQTEAEYVNDFMDSSDYKGMPDTQRVATIKKIREYAQHVAKKEFLEGKGYTYTDDKDLAEEQPDKYVYDKILTNAEKVENGGVKLHTYYEYLANSGKKQVEKIEYLENSDFTDEQKRLLYDLEGYKSSYDKAYKKAMGTTNKSSKKTTSKKTSSKKVSAPSGKITFKGPSTSSGRRNMAGNVLPTNYVQAYARSLSSQKPSSGGGGAVTCPRCHSRVTPVNGRCPVCGNVL